MRNYKVTIKVTVFGTENDRIEVEYAVKSANESNAFHRVVDLAAQDGHYVDDVELISVNLI